MHKLMLISSIAALALETAVAHAADCGELRADNDDAAIWTGALTYNDGSSNKVRRGCFLSADECFQWMGARSGRASGHFIAGHCRNQGQQMSYRQWLQQSGATTANMPMGTRGSRSPAREIAANRNPHY